MTFASLPSITATTELVVPRSMPMIFSPAAMIVVSSRPDALYERLRRGNLCKSRPRAAAKNGSREGCFWVRLQQKSKGCAASCRGRGACEMR